MRKLNRFTAFMGYKFSPVFKKAVYKNMRKKADFSHGAQKGYRAS